MKGLEGKWVAVTPRLGVTRNRRTEIIGDIERIGVFLVHKETPKTVMASAPPNWPQTVKIPKWMVLCVVPEENVEMLRRFTRSIVAEHRERREELRDFYIDKMKNSTYLFKEQ